MVFYLLGQRSNFHQNDRTNSRRPNSNYGHSNWHVNQNQFSRNDQSANSGNNADRYNRHQNNFNRTDNSSYPNYGTNHSSGQLSTRSNDRPGYYTSGYQANNSQ